MPVNKVYLGTTLKLDLSADTVEPNYVLDGYTFHNYEGTQKTGSVTFATYYTGTSTPSSSLGNDGDIYLKTTS